MEVLKHINEYKKENIENIENTPPEQHWGMNWIKTHEKY
jgi:hypothetical protein